MVSSWISLKARKGISSGIARRGLFATKRIDAGEIVVVKGEFGIHESDGAPFRQARRPKHQPPGYQACMKVQ